MTYARSSFDMRTNECSLSAFDRHEFIDAEEKRRHFRFAQKIARELRQPVYEVAPLYSKILGRLYASARVKLYLPIFVARCVRSMILAGETDYLHLPHE